MLVRLRVQEILLRPGFEEFQVPDFGGKGSPNLSSALCAKSELPKRSQPAFAKTSLMSIGIKTLSKTPTSKFSSKLRTALSAVHPSRGAKAPSFQSD